jgi:hypothetical protein
MVLAVTAVARDEARADVLGESDGARAGGDARSRVDAQEHDGSRVEDARVRGRGASEDAAIGHGTSLRRNDSDLEFVVEVDEHSTHAVLPKRRE